ncbi:pyridoxal-phosphate-dependent aminotransferase family protein [Amaricoccus macauensis]|uniref:pyridoxal-phosphate-dependent aminotransferase family protein n=1 Tax=Amaricoccus macauensis TaxID=57001 RepID=UPI003C7C30A6
MSLSFGRDLVAIPGPSVIPDRVLSAMHRASPNIYEGEIVDLTLSILADLARLAETSGDAVMYICNGHGAWEAAIANTLAPGDTALVLATGRFGLGWAEMAQAMGVEVEVMDFGFREAADPARLEKRLAADKKHRIRAVLTVQTDTASSVTNDIPALRQAIDAANHPALFMVDAIACFGCEPMRMDDWGVDVMVAGCQKGLMTPPGLAFNFVGPRGYDRRRPTGSLYWDWQRRIKPELYYQRFCGTPPTHHLFGLREALDMIAEEGISNTLLRHRRQAMAIWAAVDAWAVGSAFALNILDPAARSAAVTTIRTGRGEAQRLRAWCETNAGLTLGLGLPASGKGGSDLFRIGHMGHMNPPMLLGTLATIEAGLVALDIPHGAGALEAAARMIANDPGNTED